MSIFSKVAKLVAKFDSSIEVVKKGEPQIKVVDTSAQDAKDYAGDTFLASEAKLRQVKQETKEAIISFLKSEFASVEQEYRSNAYSMSTETQNKLLDVKTKLYSILDRVEV